MAKVVRSYKHLTLGAGAGRSKGAGAAGSSRSKVLAALASAMSIRIHLPNKGTLNPVEHLSLSLLPLQLLPPVSGPCTHCSHPEASRAFPVLFVAPDSHNPVALPEKSAEYPFQWFCASR